MLLMLILTSTISRAENLKDNNTTNNIRRDRELFKGYSGLRLSSDSFQMVYFHDLTVAVVEVGDGRSLLNCELIEIFSDNQREQLLQHLRKIIRRPPMQLPFDDMMVLMTQCEDLDPRVIINRIGQPLLDSSVSSEYDGSSNAQSSILSGILPGTKWCGVGDIAKNYFDLGPEWSMDKCCRKHDLCPVKVKANYSRYGLSNKSLYTKSHCSCDDDLAKCLKQANKTAADFMGNIYFNIIRIQCIADGKKGKQYQSARNY